MVHLKFEELRIAEMDFRLPPKNPLTSVMGSVKTMYKVLVVDDERPARETIRHIINWENTCFKIISYAKNGAEALEMYEKHRPDLIITDIQMPIIDGLELIRRIRHKDNNVKFVILSCHENFNYAKEAIKMGVSDYLLKDLITENDIYWLLQNIKDKLEKENSLIKAEHTVAEMDYEIRDNYKGLALKEMLEGNLHKCEEPSFIEKFGSNMTKKSFAILYMMIDYAKPYANGLSNQPGLEPSKILDAIYKSLESKCGGACYFNKNGEYVILACLDNNTSQLNFFADCTAICQSIRSKISKTDNFSITFGVSNRFIDLHESAARLKEAIEAAKLKIFIGQGKNIFYNTNITKTMNVSSEAVEKRINIIKSLLDKGEVERVNKELTLLYSEDLRGYMHYNYLKYINTCMFYIIIDFMNKHSIKCKEVFDLEYLPVEIPENLKMVTEISMWFEKIFEKIHQIRESKKNAYFSRRVKDAIEYINMNYAEDIGLEDIARAIGIHKGYLCRLFKQETGENLTDYIINIRINKAKQLIASTNYKLYEIAEKVGYTNSQYFSILFKKVVGMTAVEYRENCV